MSYYDRNTLKWNSADGRETFVCDLTDQHVVNILNWIQKENANPSRHTPHYGNAVYAFFEEEARLRRFIAFATNSPMPEKLENGRWVLVNLTFWGRISYHAKSLYYNTKTKLIILLKHSKLLKSLKLKFSKKLDH